MVERMKKIKTLEDLEDALDKESAWRNKEIAQIKLKIANKIEVVNEGDRSQPLTIEDKGLILILYADWEGFINTSANLYVRFVFAQNVPLKDLKTGFWEIQIHPSFENFKNISSQKAKKEFLDNLRNQFSRTKYRSYANEHKKRYIGTNSNLNSATFMGILDILGLNVNDFHLNNQFIDSLLLNYRNELAHGERGDDVKFSDMMDTVEHVRKLMNKFKESIIKAARDKLYLS